MLCHSATIPQNNFSQDYNMKPVLKAMKDPQAYINKDFLDIFPVQPNPVYFKHLDGREYSALCPGLIWPTLGGKEGIVILIGVVRDSTLDGGKPVFELLDHTFSASPRGIINACLTLREKYGHKDYSGIFSYFTGEDRFPNLLLECNASLDRPVYIMEPPDFSQATFSEILLNEIREITGDGRLKITDQTVLDSLKSMSLVDADRPLSEFPVAFAIGCCLHEMLVLKGWVYVENRVFNIDEDTGDDAFNLE